MARHAFLAAVVLALTPGCALLGPSPERSALADARARWAAAGLADYRYTISRQCFCPPEASGPFDGTVRNRTLTQLTYQGEPVDPEQLAIPAIDGLFTEIDAAYRARAATVRVTYHPTLGYPTDVWIDLDEMIADEERGYTITDVVAE